MAKVSVITTVFNEERHLANALASLADQDFDDFEVLVVDDGSTDGTLRVLEGVRDPRVRVFAAKRRGRQKALNFAVEQSVGEYVAILDADDGAYPERLRVSAEYLDTHPSVGVVGSRYRVFVDDEGEVVGTEKIDACTNAAIREALCHGNPLFHSSVTFRRSLFDRIGGYDEQLPCLEDWDLYVRISVLCKLVNLEAKLSYKRRHRGQFFDGDAGGHRTRGARRAQAVILWRTVKHLGAPKRNLALAAKQLLASWLPGAGEVGQR